MKLKLPDLEISPEEGFNQEKDIFGRKDFGERLANIFARSDEGVVVALDGVWGAGKSTFIQMWCGHVQQIEESKLKTICFDAFKNDFQKDAFLAIASEIKAIVPADAGDKFSEGAINAGKAIARGALKLGIRVGTVGVLDGTELENFGDDIGNIISGHTESIIKDRLEEAEADKKSIGQFRDVLQESVNAIQDVEHVVFVIDELDRCKPSYALEIVEVIKHFFSVKGLSFLLVVNRSQLEASIRQAYGSEINAELYLNKFVHLFCRLPKNQVGDRYGSAVKFYHYCRKNMSGNVTTNPTVVLEQLIMHFEPSLREVERIVATYNVASASGLVNQILSTFTYDDALISFCIWIHVMHPSLLNLASSPDANGAELVDKSQLRMYQHLAVGRENQVQKVIDCVLFDKGTDEERVVIEGDEENFAAYFTSGVNRAEWVNRLVVLSASLSRMSVS